jgi:hypothetical protein
MIGLETWLILGNFITAIGTLLLIKTVIKKRTLLHGYNIIGASLTFFALIVFLIGFFLASQYISAFFMSITATYWGFVVGFKLLNRNKEMQNK